VVSAATAVRLGAGCAVLMARRAMPMATLAVRGSVGPDAETAQATFRDELIALARESAELSWRELRRGLDDLDGFTRPAEDEDEAQRPARRPYRVKW
jgi:hypothetical protein